MKNNLYVGIDPSINSTGVTFLIYDENNTLIKQHFYVITGIKLTKRQIAAQEKYKDIFSYVKYNKHEVLDNMSNIEREQLKTKNFLGIVHTVINLIKDLIKQYMPYSVNICQEGISYGSSIRTKSVFDLAGLNYMMRAFCIECNFIYCGDFCFIIGTPSEIKKFATGAGNANKELMLSMFKTYIETSDTPDFDIPKMDDIADSYFMAQFVKHYIETNNIHGTT